MRTPWLLALVVTVSGSLGACSKAESHLDVTVSWNDTKQTIDGFGASSAFFGASITDAQADQLFDAKKGIGLSLLRTMIGVPDDTADDGSEPTANAMPSPTAPELVTAQQAMSRGTKIWAAAWTPPPIWKTTNNKRGSSPDAGYTTNTLQSEHYQDYATYLADFVDLMSKANPPVPIFGLSPVNEPDYTATWDNSQMNPEELTKFIRENMGPTFKTRWPNVKIIAPETANFAACKPYLDTLFADQTASDFVGVAATHPYSTGDLNLHSPQDHGKSFWETEWSQENSKGDTPDPGMTSALDMAKHIHDHMVVTGMNAWNWWAIYINEDGLNDNTRLNPAFIQPDSSKGEPYMFKRGFAFGNWSKFVRPGFKRIGATDKPTSTVLVEAYRDDSHVAIIAINTGSNTVSQKFKLDGGSVNSLTPWVTSNNDSLASKGAVNGSDFTYDLPGNSVVTFVNWDATTETPGQGSLPTTDGGTPDAPLKTGLDCANAIIPNNGGEGGITDFTDWKGSTSKWGDANGLNGNVYAYHDGDRSSMTANVDTAAKTFHITGSVMSGSYAGAGLSFLQCVTVASFTKVQFTLSGSSPGCDLELQIKTFNQQPTSQSPAGGCDQDAGNCYNFPVAKMVAVPATDPTTVTANLADFANWSTDNAGQVVGMQWQFTGANVDPDSGVGCPIDISVTGIKFVK